VFVLLSEKGVWLTVKKLNQRQMTFDVSPEETIGAIKQMICAQDGNIHFDCCISLSYNSKLRIV
jgi:riboflavin synthase alpha subunit